MPNNLEIFSKKPKASLFLPSKTSNILPSEVSSICHLYYQFQDLTFFKDFFVSKLNSLKIVILRNIQ